MKSLHLKSARNLGIMLGQAFIIIKIFGYIHALQKALPFAILNFLKFIYFIIRDGKKVKSINYFF